MVYRFFSSSSEPLSSQRSNYFLRHWNSPTILHYHHRHQPHLPRQHARDLANPSAPSADVASRTLPASCSDAGKRPLQKAGKAPSLHLYLHHKGNSHSHAMSTTTHRQEKTATHPHREHDIQYVTYDLVNPPMVQGVWMRRTPPHPYLILHTVLYCRYIESHILSRCSTGCRVPQATARSRTSMEATQQQRDRLSQRLVGG